MCGEVCACSRVCFVRMGGGAGESGVISGFNKLMSPLMCNNQCVSYLSWIQY